MLGFTINLLVNETPRTLSQWSLLPSMGETEKCSKLNMKGARKTELVKDLVCGMVLPIEKMPFKSTYKGKVYYFCSQGDKQIFDKYPDRWVRKEEKR